MIAIIAAWIEGGNVGVNRSRVHCSSHHIHGDSASIRAKIDPPLTEETMDKEQREFATATSGPCRPSCSAAEQPAVATDKLIAVEAAALGTLIAILKTVEGLRLETCKSRCAAVASLTAI